VWSSEKSVPVSLAALACWHLWIERNKVLFEDRSPSIFSVVHRILDSFSWQPSTIKVFPNKVCEITQAEGYTLACFDGATQSNGYVAELAVSSRLIRRGSPSGSLTVERDQIQKLNSWVYGRLSLWQLSGRSTNYKSLGIRKLLLTGLI
jgi:hypothetical protein